ncbi:beta-ketoacyl synthase N-terminal-like domain-containing protein [Aquirhabdus sp.]|uniref:type I polyketide synthase n=1 Tax=Aquirhabdus sp. TaxID=2824160 RepID=UPI00396C66BF
MARIAIVGMACLFPGASNMRQFWENICNGVDAISDVPNARWDASYFDPNSKAVDRFYCRRGGFVDDYADFDPLQFGIMPNIAEVVEPDQLLTLKVGYQALQDAGYSDRDFARARTGVIVGRGNYVSAGVLRLEQHVRMLPQIIQTLRDLFPDMSEEALAEARTRLQAELSYYGPDMASGLIPNLIASRLANRLDLHGPAYTVDAACASSLLAVEQACAMLSQGDVDMMLVGGAHLTHDLTFWATFCQLGALSRRGVISPLSAEADGILAGEGVGMAVLKRLEDAVTDGDRIYAVIEGTGSSSDGRSSSLVAPSAKGQGIALERAWQNLPFTRDDIGLVEAHGTGTPTGDEIELETMAEFFGPHAGSGERPVIGSVKSMIGHTMPASGMAGLIKTALSIHHGVLPPTLHCAEPHPRLATTRFRVTAKSEPWLQPREQRIAALNAFGFGGINAHLVLRGLPGDPTSNSVAALPDVLMLAAENSEILLTHLDAVIAGQVVPQGLGDCRLVVIAPDAKRLVTARKVVATGKPHSGRQQIWFTPRGLLTAGGKLAFIFPGVDSTFSPQATDLAGFFNRPLPAWCQTLDPSQDLLKVVLGLLGFNRFLFEILTGLGIKPQGFAGHSVGEWSAMLTSGMMDQALSDRTNAGLDFDAMRFPDVQFLAAACGQANLSAALVDLSEIAISHDNCPHQVIACGQRSAIVVTAERLRSQGIFVQILPIVSGFHSPLFADHMDWYRDFFGAAELREPALPVWSATSTKPFPKDMDAKRQLALDHLLEPVRFRELTEALYDDGFRVFVQVGTGSLPGFIDDTLTGRPHHALHANHEARSGLAQLQMLSAALWVEGAELDLRLLQSTQTQPPQVAMDSPLSATSRRLTLGVPLLRVHDPLPRQSRLDAGRSVAVPRLSDSIVLPNDPVGRLMRDTLADIEQAGRDVLALWQQHRAGHIAPASLPAELLTTSTALHLDTRVTRLLDLETTIPWVKDHALYPQRPNWPIMADCHPVVPLTMEVMLVREAVEQAIANLRPAWKVIEVRSIQAYNWLVVTQPVTVEITLQSVAEDTIAVEIVGYFKAQVVVAAEWSAVKTQKMAPLQQTRNTAVSAQELYSQGWMFHGPAYQGVEQLKQIGINGIDGVLRVPSGSGSLLDNMGQLAGYWVMEQPDNCLAMPIGVDCIRFHATDPIPGDLTTAEVRVREVDTLNCVSDLVLRNAQDQVCISIDGWRTRRYQMDKAFWEASRLLSKHTVSKRVPPNVMLFDDRYDTAILRDYMSRRYLTEKERHIYENLSPRKRRQWLSGRVAAKDAVLAWVRERGASSVYPQEIVIVNDEQGAPHVHANVTKSVHDHGDDHLHISISHKDHLAAAIVGIEPVGIDIERVEPRDADFIAMVFSNQEQALLMQTAELPEVSYTRGWVAKEVVAKAAGTGLGGHLRDYIVTARDGDCLLINDRWVVTHHLHDHILGWSLDSQLSFSQEESESTTHEFL